MSQCTCTKDAQITCIVHPTEGALKTRIAELEAQKTRSQEHYIKLLKDAEAENQRLREALKDAWSGLRYIRETHGELYGVGFDRVDGKYRALLGGVE